MDNIQISKMEIKDIDSVLNLEKTHNISILNRNILINDLNNDNYYYVVAKINDYIIAYIGISYILDTADIISIVVDKSYTKKGIASLLLNYIYDFCREKKITKILLEVRESNKIAQNLYTKNGFSLISKRKKYYDKTEDAYIMEKILI